MKTDDEDPRAPDTEDEKTDHGAVGKRRTRRPSEAAKPAKAAKPKRARKPRRVRASALTDAGHCLGSIATQEDARKGLGIAEADVSGTAARLGQAFHKLTEMRNVDGNTVSLVAAAYGVRMEDLWFLWSRVDTDHRAGNPDEVFVERELSMLIGEEGGRQVELTGRSDRSRRFGTALEVDDWKTGYLIARGEDDDAESHAQLHAYMLLEVEDARVREVKLTKVVGRLLIVRTRRVETFEASAGRFKAMRHSVVKLALDADAQRDLELGQRTYTVGDHCRHCDGRAICPAFRSGLNATLAPLLQAPDEGVKPDVALVDAAVTLVSEQPERAWFLRDMSSRIREALDTAIRQRVEWVGPIPCGDGREIRVSEYDREASLSEGLIREALASSSLDADQQKEVIDVIKLTQAANTRAVQRLGKYKVKQEDAS